MQNYKRSTRVGELIQKEISKIIQEIKDPGLGFVTITGVKLTDDLQDARVFYSVIGSDDARKKTDEVLQESLKSIRHELASRINMRRTPSLTFSYDDTAEKATRIFELLEKLDKEEKPPQQEEKPPQQEEKPEEKE
jgi:ribosome-binding factor A